MLSKNKKKQFYEILNKYQFNYDFSIIDITCIQGNAENLPFEDNTFDAYTIAFGIRNVVHIDQVSYDFSQFFDMHQHSS